MPAPAAATGGVDGGAPDGGGAAGGACLSGQVGTTNATPGTILVDDVNLYWADAFASNGKGAIVVLPKSGGTAAALAEAGLDPASKSGGIELAQDATSIYWAATNGYVAGESATLYRVAKSGGAVVTVAALGFDHGVSDLVVDGGTIYFLGRSNKAGATGVFHVATSGGAVVQDASTDWGSLAQDGSFLYIASSYAKTIKRVAKGGSTELLLAGNVANLSGGIAVDGARVYFDDLAGAVYAVDKNGGAVATLHAGTSTFPVGGQLTLDGGRLFWRESANALAGMNSDGSAFAVVDAAETVGAAADARFVYYARIPDNGGAEPVMRACR